MKRTTPRIILKGPLCITLLMVTLFVAFGGAFADDEIPPSHPKGKGDKIFCISQSEPDPGNPMFLGVERVSLLVKVTAGYMRDKEAQEKLPALLRMESLRDIAKENLVARYTTRGGRLVPSNTPGCLGRADQPVTVYEFKNLEDWKAFFSSLETPRTLGVYIQVSIQSLGDYIQEQPGYVLTVSKRLIRLDMPSSENAQHILQPKTAIILPEIKEENLESTLHGFL